MSENIFVKGNPGQSILQLRTEPLYYRSQVSTTSTSVKFFHSTDSTTPLITNIVQPGTLGQPNEFYVQGLGFHPQEGIAQADAEKLYDYSYLRFLVSGIERWTAPLFLVPNPCSLQGAVATTASATTVSKFANVSHGQQGAYFPLSTPSTDKGNVIMSPIKLDSLETFSVELVIAPPSSFSANFYAWAILFGYFAKAR